MTSTAPMVVWLDEQEHARPELLGGKLGSLAELTAAGFAVPRAFGITTEGFRLFVEQAGPLNEIRRRRHDVDRNDLGAVAATSEGFAQLIEQASMPAELEEAVRGSYARMERETETRGAPVAVRSSGVSEDLAGASFAGQYDTYLWIRGVDDVLRHVKLCWTGLLGTAVLTYRPREDLQTEEDVPPGMCVGVQQMVPSRTAGVMFTLDPINGDRSKIVIEGCWGLGEGVVSGDVTPDRFRVDKVTLELLERTISAQTEEHRFDEQTGSVALLPVELERGARSCLDDAEVIALAELAKRVERHRGAPQDLEWAIDQHGTVHLLQARPETVWSQKPARTAATGSGAAVDRVLAKFMNVGGGK